MWRLAHAPVQKCPTGWMYELNFHFLPCGVSREKLEDTAHIYPPGLLAF